MPPSPSTTRSAPRAAAIALFIVTHGVASAVGQDIVYLAPANREGTEVSLFLKVYFTARGRDLVLNLNAALPDDAAVPEITDRITTTIARAQHATLML